MARGLEQFLERIKVRPDEKLVQRYLALTAEIGDEREKARALLDLADVIMGRAPKEALRLAHLVFQSDRTNLRSLRVVIGALESLGKYGKAEVIQNELERLEQLASQNRLPPAEEPSFIPVDQMSVSRAGDELVFEIGQMAPASPSGFVPPQPPKEEAEPAPGSFSQLRSIVPPPPEGRIERPSKFNVPGRDDDATNIDQQPTESLAGRDPRDYLPSVPGGDDGAGDISSPSSSPGPSADFDEPIDLTGEQQTTITESGVIGEPETPSASDDPSYPAAIPLRPEYAPQKSSPKEPAPGEFALDTPESYVRERHDSTVISRIVPKIVVKRKKDRKKSADLKSPQSPGEPPSRDLTRRVEEEELPPADAMDLPTAAPDADDLAITASLFDYYWQQGFIPEAKQLLDQTREVAGSTSWWQERQDLMAALEKRLTAKPDPAMEQSPTLPPPKIPQQAEPVALPPPPPTGSRRLKSKPLNFETFYASLWQEFYRIRPAVSVEGGHLPELPQEFFQALAEAVQTSNPSQRTSALELIRLLFSGCANIQLARFLNNHDLHMHNTDLFCLYLDGLLAGGLPRQVWAAGYTYLNRNRDLFSARLVFRRLRRAAISLRIPALRWREEQGIESLLGMIRRRPSSIPSLSVLVGDL